MEYRRLGATGVRLSTVGLGTWVTFGQQVDQKGADRLLGSALDLGINFIDTADVYAGGRAEEMLGKVLAGQRRSGIVLATKAFGKTGEGPNDQGLSRKHLIEACDASLSRLKTDYVDLFQCHRYDTDTPLEEVVEAMDHLVRQGKVLYWGVSEWSAVQIVEATRVARERGLAAPTSNQPIYNLFNRTLEIDVMRVCERYGLGIVCFSPLAQGILTGKYRDGERPAGSRAADPATAQWMEKRMTGENLAKVEKMREVAERLGLTPARLALAWCLRHPVVTSVIIGATRAEQIEDNAGAAGVPLDPAVLDELEEIFGSAPRHQYTGERTGYGHERSGW